MRTAQQADRIRGVSEPDNSAGELVTYRNRGGRKSTFSWETVDAICERLSIGEPLAQICRDEGMPALRTVYDWAEADKEVAAYIARAREEGEDAIASDCILIADDATGDFRMGEKSILADTDHIQRSKLRIETRLKLLAKWNPKKWGEKVDHAHTGKISLESLVSGSQADE